MAASDSTDTTYGSYADYFNTSSGTKSQGKAGSASGSAQQYSAPQSASGSTGSTGGSDNTQGGNAQSGSDSWISAAVSQTSSDKSTFTTPFSQQFGGITNNQIIDSAGATGAVTSSPIAPISGAAPDGSGGGTYIGGVSFSPVELALAIMAGIALILYTLKR